jgi:hypothetical protein
VSVDPVGAGAAQRVAKAELARHEYRHGGPSWPARALHWVGRQLSHVFSGGGSHALLLVGVVILAVGLVFALRAGLPGWMRRGRQTSVAVDPLAVVAARDHRRLAEQLTAQHQWAEALREWLRAAIATIEERGVLLPQPGRTGATTAREAGPLLPTAATELQAATQAFDEVWFGGRSATEADVAHARAAADAVQSARLTGAVQRPSLAVPQ